MEILARGSPIVKGALPVGMVVTFVVLVVARGRNRTIVIRQ
jgi:hypothetical protein